MKNWNKNQISKYLELKKTLADSNWSQIIHSCFSDAIIVPASGKNPNPTIVSHELAGFYVEIEKLEANYGCEYIFSPERMSSVNRKMRGMNGSGLYMNFDSMIIFGEAGNGDYFFSPLVTRDVVKDDVFMWDHETDSRVWVASGIKDMFFRLSSSMIG